MPERISTKAEIEWMKEMMKSCFAYYSLMKTNNYLLPYKDRLGEELYNKIYDEYSKELENKYTIKNDVYTDSEGCSYNELIEK